MRSLFVLLELDECASHPCMNNGSCTDLENGFLCNCLPEWNGTLCTELKSRCSFILLKRDFNESRRYFHDIRSMSIITMWSTW